MPKFHRGYVFISIIGQRWCYILTKCALHSVFAVNIVYTYVFVILRQAVDGVRAAVKIVHTYVSIILRQTVDGVRVAVKGYSGGSCSKIW